MLPLLLMLAAPGIDEAVKQAVDPCRAALAAGGIVVCGKTETERQQRYRLQREDRGFDPSGPVDSVSRERHRLMDVGDASVGSCSSVGASGATGCLVQQWRANQQQRGW